MTAAGWIFLGTVLVYVVLLIVLRFWRAKVQRDMTVSKFKAKLDELLKSGKPEDATRFFQTHFLFCLQHYDEISDYLKSKKSFMEDSKK